MVNRKHSRIFFATLVSTSGLAFYFTRSGKIAAGTGFLEALFVTLFIWIDRPVKAQHAVVWLTGLSGAGKTTIAVELARKLTARGQKVEILDGDTIRNIFPDVGFTPGERIAHIKRVGYLASRLEKNGVFVIAALISPYEDSRKFVRDLCKNYLEIYVSTPLAECERRDVKGLYAKARQGTLTNFTGIDSAYEVPHRPELVINTVGKTPQESTDEVFDFIVNHQLMNRETHA